jgi:glycosyltransferase involved in cell wall biosynthesis
MVTHVTGIGVYLRHVIDYLIEQQIDCVLFYDQIPVPQPNPVAKIVILPSQRRWLWEQVLLPRAMQICRLDGYHATWNHGVPLFSLCPAIVTLHDVIPLAWDGYRFGSARQRIAYKLMLQLSLRKARLVLTDSQSSKNDILKFTGLSPKKVRSIYLGVGHPYCPIDDIALIEETKQRYGVQSDYIIYVGGMDPRKNIDGLIKAFAQFRNQLAQEVELVIVGHKNQLYQRLSKLSQSLGLGKDQVVFTGYVPDEHMPALISGATMLVYPSFYEGFGVPVLEGMACGTPVITSSRSATAEIAADAAVLVEPGSVQQICDAIIRLWKDESLRQMYRLKGLQRVQSFSWQRSVEEILEAYRTVFG